MKAKAGTREGRAKPRQGRTKARLDRAKARQIQGPKSREQSKDPTPGKVKGPRQGKGQSKARLGPKQGKVRAQGKDPR
jgi:hypothetical protein